MTALAAFCARTGIDQAAARKLLAARAQRDESPWYMQAVLGIGAWITAIAGLFFVAAVLHLGFDIDEPDLVVAIIGAVVFAGSLWLLHLRPDGAFAAHASVAFAAAGTILVAAGIGTPESSMWRAAAATFPFAAVAMWQQRSPLLQFLVVSVAVILSVLSVWDHWHHVIADLPALAIPAGAAILLYPPRRNVWPAAFVLLIVPQLLEILASDFESGWTWLYGWPAKALLVALFACLFAINWRRVTDPQARSFALAGGTAVVAVAILLPTGVSAAMVLLALAYTLGSRSLAVVGALMEVYFIWRFYDDLGSTLLTKSMMLMAAGGVLLICYGLLFVATRGRRPT